MTSKIGVDYWNESAVVDYYENHRACTRDVYPSEWYFLKDLLSEGMSVLDIGCALGGFAGMLEEHLREFHYTGLDISSEMIRRAKVKFPRYSFHVIEEADLSILGDTKFDLVLSLGILHLSRKWRELVPTAWRHTRNSLLLDLRETHGPSFEDEAASYFTLAAYSEAADKAPLRLPYNVINSAEAVGTLIEGCHGFQSFRHLGYIHPVSPSAVTPAKQVMMTTYCVDRRKR